jgi:hypothetical protein
MVVVSRCARHPDCPHWVDIVPSFCWNAAVWNWGNAEETGRPAFVGLYRLSIHCSAEWHESVSLRDHR